MISIVLLLPFFSNNLYCMHCIYNVVVVVVEINFNFSQIYCHVVTHEKLRLCLISRTSLDSE